MTHPHPAVFSDPIIDRIGTILDSHLGGRGLVLDPFAGIGRIHELRDRGYETVGVEIEAPWADLSEHTVRGDSTHLPGDWAGRFDAVATSPTYGNRMADHHNAEDGSHRRSYTHDMRSWTGDRDYRLDNQNTGKLYAWQHAYWTLHKEVWRECRRVLKSSGLLILNASDFIRSGERFTVTDRHVELLHHLGFAVETREVVKTSRMRRGENGEARVNGEDIVVLRGAADSSRLKTRPGAHNAATNPTLSSKRRRATRVETLAAQRVGERTRTSTS